MAVYKVAQDVEADDKLLGPFTFRQFIYLVIAATSGFIAFGLSRIAVPLLVLPLPLVFFFGALALPLRRDQPTEVYFAAILSFYLKPRKRLWIPDGKESLIEITAPKVVEIKRSKDLSTDETTKRLSYLANIADTGGWAIRNVDQPSTATAMISDVFNEAMQTEDVLDTSSSVGQAFEERIDQADEKRRQDMVQRMRDPAAFQVPAQPSPAPSPAVNLPDPYASIPAPIEPQVSPTYNPYPTSIHQSVIQPLSQQAQIQQAPVGESNNNDVTTSEKPVSPDIINLANNPDLSIETIAREAHRIKDKEEKKDDDEVYISLH